jgi:hypothetical protein
MGHQVPPMGLCPSTKYVVHENHVCKYNKVAATFCTQIDRFDSYNGLCMIVNTSYSRGRDFEFRPGGRLS